MGQIDITCRECHKLIWQFHCDEVGGGYWAFVVVCGKCKGATEKPDESVQAPPFADLTEGYAP